MRSTGSTREFEETKYKIYKNVILLMVVTIFNEIVNLLNKLKFYIGGGIKHE